MLVDSSAWVEYLRRTESPTNVRLRELLAARRRVAITEPIVFEVLMGAQSEAHADRLRRLLVSLELRPLEGLRDAERAAQIYRGCRRRGHTVRSSVDCLIAAVALRADLPVLALDRDFEAIAEETGLELV
ncbi:MAG: PIN domain nuclease [Gemmatimonadetes bacterium]|nr:PIN domain nuclease [Gemmatimonadota bacterium]